MLKKRNSWLRTSAFAVLGLGLAYGTQSFTQKVEKSADFVEWKYEGTSNSLSQALDADNYSPAGSAACGGTPQTICRISAPEDLSNPGHPDMSASVGSSTVGADIQNSVSNPTPTTNNTVKSLRSF